jgi:site-specific recombinase XerD
MFVGKYCDLYSEDLRLKNYAESSIENYVSQIRVFLNRFEKQATKPSEINESQIKQWLLESNSINGRRHRLSALKLFYRLTIKQPMKLKYVEYPRPEKKLPIVLSSDEIQSMFNVCQNLKHRVILALLYGTGMRVGELINLQWSHIDRKRMVIHIIAGKGAKDRQVQLSQSLIELLEKYFKEYKCKPYVLSGQFSEKYSEKSVNEVLKQLSNKAGIKKHVHAHLMRHSAFTNLLEFGVDISIIQKIAGHSSSKTTEIYTHVSTQHLNKIVLPI